MKLQITHMFPFKHMLGIVKRNDRIDKSRLSSSAGLFSYFVCYFCVLFKIAVLSHVNHKRKNYFGHLDYSASLNDALYTFNVSEYISLRDTWQFPTFDLNINREIFPRTIMRRGLPEP